MEKKDIYDLSVGEETQVEHFYVLRVPGGWIYYDYEGSMAYVPFVPRGR